MWFGLKNIEGQRSRKSVWNPQVYIFYIIIYCVKSNTFYFWTLYQTFFALNHVDFIQKWLIWLIIYDLPSIIASAHCYITINSSQTWTQSSRQSSVRPWSACPGINLIMSVISGKGNELIYLREHFICTFRNQEV